MDSSPSPATDHRSQITDHRSQITVHSSQFTVHSSQFTVHTSHLDFSLHTSCFTLHTCICIPLRSKWPRVALNESVSWQPRLKCAMRLILSMLSSSSRSRASTASAPGRLICVCVCYVSCTCHALPLAKACMPHNVPWRHRTRAYAPAAAPPSPAQLPGWQ